MNPEGFFKGKPHMIDGEFLSYEFVIFSNIQISYQIVTSGYGICNVRFYKNNNYPYKTIILLQKILYEYRK